MTSTSWGQDLEAFWRHLCTSTVKEWQGLHHTFKKLHLLMNNYPVQLFKKKINKQDGGCWKGPGLPPITCLFLLLISLLLGFLSFQRYTSWVPEEYLKSHFRHLSEIMTEECDIGCCGHIIHPHV